MSDTIQIPAKHFIGSGKSPWLIIGRVPGDDDDTGYLVLADDEGQAHTLFVEALHDSAEIDDDDRADLIGRYGADHFITTSQMLA
jgi:uracil-DNA glycosylase